jgi:cytochrome c oxidase subunit 1
MNIQNLHILMTLAGFAIFIGVLIGVYNLVVSARRGEVAVMNPWGSRSPEWQIPSPVPEHNYEEPFEVVGNPYDYGLPGTAYVRMNGHEKAAAPAALPAH